LKHVFVTGATGLLGKEILRQLAAGPYRVSALSRRKGPENPNLTWWQGDLGDVLLLEKILQDVDFIIHAAALVSFDPADRAMLNRTNVEGTANLVNAALASDRQPKLVHISSMASMTPSKPMPAEVDERQGFNPDDNTSDYAWSKYKAELEVYRGIEEGLKASILNPSIILNPEEESASSGGLLGYVRKGGKFYLEGWINYVDVQDVARVALFMLENGPEDGKRFLLSAGHLSYQEFFTKVANRMQVPAPTWKASALIRNLGWRADRVISFISGKKPLLTRFTAASSAKRFIYKGKNLEEFWPDFRYTGLDEILSRIRVPSA
jgi:nucleoside-diphosphate-sugar epimerase